MYQYQCEICNKDYTYDSFQNNPICDDCRAEYGISEEYISSVKNKDKNQNVSDKNNTTTSAKQKNLKKAIQNLIGLNIIAK